MRVCVCACVCSVCLCDVELWTQYAIAAKVSSYARALKVEMDSWVFGAAQRKSYFYIFPRVWFG